jgi:hypothetical protein
MSARASAGIPSVPRSWVRVALSRLGADGCELLGVLRLCTVEALFHDLIDLLLTELAHPVSFFARG